MSAHFSVGPDQDEHDDGTDGGQQDIEAEGIADGLQRAVFGLVGPEGPQRSEHHAGEDEQGG